MASDRGKESAETSPPDPGDETSSAKNAIPELVRRALAAGFSGFFLTEEAFRRALGDALPKDWSDFAIEQSGRARSEIIERMSFEVGRALEHIDWALVLSSMLEGRTLEVKAEIRLSPKDDDTGGVTVALTHGDREE